MTDDLIASLRALAAAQHADLPLAADAVIEIEKLTRERDEARAEVERLRAEMLELAEWCEAEEPLSHKKLSYRLRYALEAKQ